MSSKAKKDNEDNKLRDLLNKGASGNTDGLDDFEKEALEGFAGLENPDEAFEMKAALDKRAWPLFKPEEKSRAVAYWFAAAAVLLITGLAGYFLMQSTGNNPPALALNVETKNKTETPAGFKSDSTLVKMRMSDSTKDKDDMGSALPEQNNTVNTRTEQKDGMAKTVSLNLSSTSAADENQFKSTEDMAATQAKEEQALMNLMAAEQMEKQKALVEATSRMEAEGTWKKAQSNERDLRTEPPKMVVEKPERKMQPEKETPPAAAEPESKKPEVLTGNPAGLTSFGATATSAAPGYIVSDSSAIRIQGSDDKLTSVEGKGKKKKFRTVANKNNYEGVRDAALYYRGGEAGLKQDLTSALRNENLLKAFDVMIYASKEKGIVKVNFNTTYKFAAQEEEAIKAIINRLKFELPAEAPKDQLFSLKLHYTPD